MVTNIIEAFADLPDPRREHPQKLHKLIDIVVIAVCAVIAKCETWEEIADYGEVKQDFFERFLVLPNGVPSHDTFNRVFSLLDPVAWQGCFMAWMRSVSQLSRDKLVSVDGKMLRGELGPTGRALPVLAQRQKERASARRNKLHSRSSVPGQARTNWSWRSSLLKSTRTNSALFLNC